MGATNRRHHVLPPPLRGSRRLALSRAPGQPLGSPQDGCAVDRSAPSPGEQALSCTKGLQSERFSLPRICHPDAIARKPLRKLHAERTIYSRPKSQDQLCCPPAAPPPSALWPGPWRHPQTCCAVLPPCRWLAQTCCRDSVSASQPAQLLRRYPTGPRWERTSNHPETRGRAS